LVVQVFRRAARGALALAAAATILAALGGCADDTPPTVPVSSPATQTSPASAVPGSPAEPTTDPGEIPHQFATIWPRCRLNATYDPRLPVADWTGSVNKPLSLSLTTVNGRKGGQKIYLTRVTVTITARDDTGPLDSPRPLVDTANISPGFIVTFPYTYGQDFVVPSLDEGATSVTLDFTYEFLLQVSKDSRDYYKQTAIDTLVVPIRS